MQVKTRKWKAQSPGCGRQCPGQFTLGKGMRRSDVDSLMFLVLVFSWNKMKIFEQDGEDLKAIF